MDVKDYRKKLNLSRKKLAKFMGISHRTIENWEQERYPIPKIARKTLTYLRFYLNHKQKK